MARADAAHRRWRIGAVSYLNTKPLIEGLAQQTEDLELILDLPSRLADALAAGRLDVALIPSVEYLRHPAYTRVSDACIACRGPVLSVKLLSRVPLAEIHTLALDVGSRTSAALVRILLHHQYDIRPATRPLPIGQSAESADTDAVLVIGDRAMHSGGHTFPIQCDLGEQWVRWSGLPFVFAVWAARPGVDREALASILSAARNCGLARLDVIAEREARGVALSSTACRHYLRDNLHFFLGAAEQDGLKLFQRQCVTLDLLPAAGERLTIEWK